MKPLNDLLIWVAALFGLALWVWSLSMGAVSPHFFLIIAILIAASVLISYGARRQHRNTQDAYIAELNSAMSEYNTLSTDAMTHAEMQFSSLENDMIEAQQIIRESVNKLSGSLTGLESQSSNQRAVLRSLIDEMLQMTGSDDNQAVGQAGLQRFFDETHTLIAEFVSKMSQLQTTSQGMPSVLNKCRIRLGALPSH